ncbi:hypothetical protein Asppvi_005831 [Aspergillus pseudoviridinutans]|uniref:Uncharacterized protein n=1 Tax=Aspergillus pseudoviridinutans TaxID=1517512 RepID=A0A9P3EUS6_9EURO|nr:uncharacterized protein Asppvi_005831 [Aspergillus pseudoviridinutans]GIJ86932.1 hypothetical protein Asppvi_005831 [Aspergillus pseudoviridinutans]
MSEPLSLSLKPIIDKIGSLISEGKVGKTTIAGGWRYSGEDFETQIAELEKAMTDGGNDVVACHATHFTRGANIGNPTGRLILIQIHGTSILDPGGLLSPGSYQYLEDSRTLISQDGKGVDIGVVVLAKNSTFKKV